MTRVLLTGGSGFIAAHVLDHLIQRGYSVVTTVRSTAKADKIRAAYPTIGTDRLDFAIVEDIAQDDAFDDALISTSPFEAVIHTASPFHFNVTNVQRDLLDPATKGTTGLLRSIVKNAPSVKQVVITSSFASVVNPFKGSWPEHTYTEEDWNPVTLQQASESIANGYRASKTFAEKAAWEFLQQQEPPLFSLTTICPPLVLGPVISHLSSLDNLNTSNQVIRDLIQGKHKDKIPDNMTFTWVDVRDLALCHVLALEKPEAANQRFLVAAGYFCNRELVDIIRKQHPRLRDRLPAENSPGGGYPEAGLYKVDSTKATKILGVTWKKLPDTVTDTVNSLQRQYTSKALPIGINQYYRTNYQCQLLTFDNLHTNVLMGDDKVECESWEVQPNVVVTEQYIQAEPTWAKYIPGGYSRSRCLKLSGMPMVACILGLAGTCLLFFGYDAAVMSLVNINPDYLEHMDSAGGTDRDAARVGGIVSFWFLGFLLGAILAGSYADKIGRLKSIQLGCVWGIVGACLLASAQNFSWMVCGRIISGIGCGHLNTIAPIWTSEIADYNLRGAYVSVQFTMCVAGATMTYWMEYAALKTRSLPFAWRFPQAFQMVFLILILLAANFFPETPRHLAKTGRFEEAREILRRCRLRPSEQAIDQELAEIREAIRIEATSSAHGFLSMIWKKDALHTRRRVALAMGIQAMEKLCGPDAIAAYGPIIFGLSGFTGNLPAMLAGFNFISYTCSVPIGMYFVERAGRRKLMLIGLLVMGSALLIAGPLAREAINTPETELSKKRAYGAAVVAFVFLYTCGFGSTWITCCWVYPTEVFPLATRAKGVSLSMVSFAIWGAVINEVIPYVISAVGWWVFIMFAVMNFIQIIPVWLFYVETANRHLEDLDVLFASDSPLAYKMERPSEVLIKLNVTGLCLTDVHFMMNDWAFPKMSEMGLSCAGHEGAGVIVKIGENVKSCKVGQRAAYGPIHNTCTLCEYCKSGRETYCQQAVYTGGTVDGTYKQYCAVPEGFVHLIPEGVSDYVAGPAMCSAGTMYSSLKESGLRAGDWAVFPGGGGGTGIQGVQLACAMGIRVVVVDTGESRRSLSLSLGAEDFVDFLTEADPVKKVLEVTNGGAHGVFVSAVQAYPVSLGYLGSRVGGVVMWYVKTPYIFQLRRSIYEFHWKNSVGLPPKGRYHIDTDPTQLCLNNQSIKGTLSSSRKDIAETLDFAKRGKIHLEPVVVGMSKFNEAVQRLKNGQVAGRIVVDFNLP
ncbi:hypothetical protein CLAIMM_03441 [Cladophialophora immunda]|nr:hypothetical protein CLAIMM_03441 [Cladophialophora immunda]